MRLILTRHGETVDNKAKIIQGHLGGKLSKDGIIQAKKLATRLKDEKIDIIFSSDLKRAKDTTYEIIKFHKKVPVIYVEELRERNFGSFNGKSYLEVGKLPLPKDAESDQEFINRAKNFVKNIYKEHPTKTILFVGHNGINKKIIHSITKNKKIDKQKNTAISIFEIGDKDHRIHKINCIKHLS